MIENMTKETSRNRIIKNIKDFHRTVMSAITIATNTTDRTNHKKTSPNKQQNYKILPKHAKTQ